jgi:integrase
MASHYRRAGSPYYWMRVKNADGSWRSLSTGIRVDADGALRKIQQRISDETAREKRISGESTVLLRAWVPQWIDYNYSNVFSRKRAHNAWAHLSQYLRTKNVLHPEEVTYGLCHGYMQWRTDAEACGKEGRRLGNWNTALTEIRILGAILQESVRRGTILANPCARLRLGRKDVKEKPPFEPEEVADIEEKLKDAHQWMRDSWLVAIKHGCRLSEVMVPMTRINTRTKIIVFRVKGGKMHNAPLHKDLLPLVARRKEEKAALLVDLPNNASKLWNQWLTNHGYPNHSFHCLRVTVITRLALADVTAEKAMQYVGHCSELVHAIYRRIRPKDVAALGDHL